MMKIKKFIIILIIGIPVLLGCFLLIKNILRNDTNIDAIIKSDKEAIISRFPNLGDIKKCYWKADVLDKNNNGRVPSPSSYWMKGFIELDKYRISNFIEKYDMYELSSDPDFEFLPENYDLSTSRWFYSDMFNEYVITPDFSGFFYIDNVNKVIYFEVIK